MISVEVLLAAMVGGRGLVLGPLVGAFTLHGVGDLTKQVAGGIHGIDLAVYGAVLIWWWRSPPWHRRPDRPFLGAATPGQGGV